MENPGVPGIYVLLNPRTLKARYIGKAKYCTIERNRDRYRGKPRAVDTTPLANWRRELQSAGLLPNLELLEFCPYAPTDRKRFNEAERWWIALYRAAGLSDLNVTDGGDGWTGLPQSGAARAGGLGCRGRGRRQRRANLRDTDVS